MNYKDIMQAIYDRMRERVVGAVIGLLPPAGGVAIACNGGTAHNDMAGNALVELRIGVNSKASGQAECLALMEQAHEVLRSVDHLHGDGWQIVSVRVLNTPATAGKDAQNMWILTSQVLVKAYVLGGME